MSRLILAIRPPVAKRMKADITRIFAITKLKGDDLSTLIIICDDQQFSQIIGDSDDRTESEVISIVMFISIARAFPISAIILLIAEEGMADMKLKQYKARA